MCNRWLPLVRVCGLNAPLLGRTNLKNFSTSRGRTNIMPAWVIDEYGGNDVLRFTKNAPFPIINYPNEVIVKVHSAALNPIDVSMRGEFKDVT